MSWSSDWLYKLLLERARETFAEAKRAAKERRESLPTALIATEHSQYHQETPMPTGDPIRAWSTDDDFELPLTVIPELHRRNLEGRVDLFDAHIFVVYFRRSQASSHLPIHRFKVWQRRLVEGRRAGKVGIARAGRRSALDFVARLR